MRVENVHELRRNKRVEYVKPFHGVTVDEEFDGLIEDISASGASVATNVGGPQFSNFDFVELHIESMNKKILAQVVRKYEGGFAVKFDVDQKEQAHIQKEIDQFQQTSGLQNI